MFYPSFSNSMSDDSDFKDDMQKDFLDYEFRDANDEKNEKNNIIIKKPYDYKTYENSNEAYINKCNEEGMIKEKDFDCFNEDNFLFKQKYSKEDLFDINEEHDFSNNSLQKLLQNHPKIKEKSDKDINTNLLDKARKEEIQKKIRRTKPRAPLHLS